MWNSVSGLQLSALHRAIHSSKSAHSKCKPYIHAFHLFPPILTLHLSHHKHCRETLFSSTHELFYKIKCTGNKMPRGKSVIAVRQFWKHQGNFLCQKRNQQNVCPANNLFPPTTDSVHGKHQGNQVNQPIHIPITGQHLFTTQCTIVSQPFAAVSTATFISWGMTWNGIGAEGRKQRKAARAANTPRFPHSLSSSSHGLSRVRVQD